MSPFAALLLNELRLMIRQKVIQVALGATLFQAAIIYFVPQDYRAIWLPAILFTEVITVGVLFVAGVIFLEKKQQSIIAFAVTPVPSWQWLAAKTIAFTLLCFGCGALLIASTLQLYQPLVLILAFLLSGLLYNQIGMAVALWSEDIRGFFMPLSVVMGASSVTVYAHLGLSDNWLFWLLPSHPAMILLNGGINGISWPMLALCVGLLVGWNLLALLLCLKVFRHKVCQRLSI